MTVENISWSISTKECCRPRRGLNPRPPGLQSDGASNWATEAGCSSFELDLEIIKTNILSQIHDDCFKNVTARVLTRFSADLARWPTFCPTWPSFKHTLELTKTNILSKIHDYCFKNVTARVLTRFSAGLARWPSFWHHVTQFQIWPRNHQDKHFEQDSWWLLEKFDRWSVNKVSSWFGSVT